MSIRLVQITDTHLYRDPNGVLAGVSTWKTFRAVLERIEREHGDFDYLILTGDLAEDGEFETYSMLRHELGDWLERCRIIPGNHDDPANLRKAFPELFPQDVAALTFALPIGNWKIIGLDSHLPGETRGHLGPGQLRWLGYELSTSPDARTLIFVHHPPVAINVAWLDRVKLDSTRELLDIIQGSPQIEAICAGHVHQEFTGQIGGTAMYTTPSTSVQFGSRNRKSFDTRAAGYRTFRLEDDHHHTAVHRLSD